MQYLPCSRSPRKLLAQPKQAVEGKKRLWDGDHEEDEDQGNANLPSTPSILNYKAFEESLKIKASQV
jgi:hypothetical protein